MRAFLYIQRYTLFTAFIAMSVVSRETHNETTKQNKTCYQDDVMKEWNKSQEIHDNKI